LAVFYPSFYVVLKNWKRKCFWTSVVYILWNGLYCNVEWLELLIPSPEIEKLKHKSSSIGIDDTDLHCT